MSGDLDWPINASRRFVSISRASCYSVAKNQHFAPSVKTMNWIKNGWYLLEWARRALITMQSLGKIVQRAPGVGAIIWCLKIFLVCHTPRSERCTLEGDIVWTSIMWRFMGRLWCDLHRFFRRDRPFRCNTWFTFSSLDGATNSEKWRSKIAKIQKIGRKVCAHHFI